MQMGQLLRPWVGWAGLGLGLQTNIQKQALSANVSHVRVQAGKVRPALRRGPVHIWGCGGYLLVPN